MDVEKYTGSKVFIFFEWAFKLILWNIILILLVMTSVSLPFYGFYKVQDNNLIENVVIDGDSVTITQKNDRVTVFDDLLNDDNFKVKEYSINLINESKEEDGYLIKVICESNILIEYKTNIKYKEITIDNKVLYGDGVELTKLNNLSYESSKVNRDGFVEIKYSDTLLINLGVTIEVQNTLAGIFIIIAVIIGVFVFIPTFVTIFSMIKIFGEDGNASIGLFFDRLWDNFKSLWKLELIMIPIVFLFTFATYFYYMNIISSDKLGSFASLYVIGYNFLLVTLIIIFFCLLNLPMTLGYFRMDTKSIMKFTFMMTFKNILFSFIYFFSFLIPVLLCVINTFFLPMWFVCGISLPLYVCYLVSRTKYRYLVKNLEDITEELTENTDIYKFDENKGE